MRERYDEVLELGGDVLAIGTGNTSYAADFVASERVPFLVVVDDDALAARAMSIPRVNPFRLLFDLRSLSGSRRAHRDGYRIGRPGTRVNQLGATFVVGPGDVVHYAHVDAHTADHAPIDDVIDAVRAATEAA